MNKNISNLGELSLNIKQKDMVCTIINCFGTGGHPFCDNRTFNYFTISYLKKLINSAKFKCSCSNFTKEGKEIYKSIELALN